MRLHHSPVLFITTAFVALGLIYSAVTPIFEAPDEVSHYAVVRHIVDTGSLPLQRVGVKTAWEQEGSQPPLYYLLSTILISGLDTSDAAERMYRNPHAAPGDPSLDANRNLVIHSRAEDFPWRGTTLAVHLLRMASIAMGAMTVMIAYAIARRLFPDRPSVPIGVALLIALNPMFLFISASINNDNLVIVLSSLALYLLIECWHEPAGRVQRSGWLRRVALAIVIGCAVLTKISGLMLLPIAALTLTVRHLRRRDWFGWVTSGLLIATAVIAIAGWWYARNHQLYGEWLGLETMVAIAGPRPAPLTLAQLIGEFDGFRYSYWALFGAVNIVTVPIAYVIFDLFTLMALIGWLLWIINTWRRGERDRLVLIMLLALYAFIVFVGVVRWTMMTPASQGRLLFPAIAVISLILWLGWETIWKILDFRFRILDRGRWFMPIFLIAVAAFVPFHDIAPAYAGPREITSNHLPHDLHVLNVDYGAALRLIGYQLPASTASADAIDFTLYWQCLTQPDADYSVFAIVYGRNLEEVGKRDAYPYHGLFATTSCSSGTIFADPYHIRLKTMALRPTVLRVQIGLKDWANTVELKPFVGGQPISAMIFIGGKLAPAPVVRQPAQRGAWQLGDAITLTGYTIDKPTSPLRITLFWRPLSRPTDSYTVFVHVLDERGQQIAQADSLPLGGEYPTDWWDRDEMIVDEHQVELPNSISTGAYHVAIGAYRLSDGERLPVKDANGHAVPDGQINLQP